MEFLKSAQLELNGGNYLVSKETGKPVTNAEFVAEQVKAHFVVTLAAKCKGKSFKAKEVVSFATLVDQTTAELKKTSGTVYYEKEAEPKSDVLDELIKAAKAFHKNDTTNERVVKMNNLLQEYNSINKVENFGMYFSSEVVELDKLYSITDIKAAIEVIVDLD